MEILNWLKNFLEQVFSSITADLLIGVGVFVGAVAMKSQLFNKMYPRFVKVGDQHALYRETMDNILRDPAQTKEVVFIHHSGTVIIQDICKLLDHNVNVVLYQQNPDIPLLHMSKYCERIRGVTEDIIHQSKNTIRNKKHFKGKLIIKQFSAPATLRVMLVDDQIAIVSWYVYRFDDGDLDIRGSESPAIWVSKKSQKFEQIYTMISDLRAALDKECKGGAKNVFDNVQVYESSN